MKKRKFIAGLLSLVMLISTIGGMDVNAAESAYGTEIATGLTEGEYIDIDANVNEDYVYTVVGSDGSVAEISTDTYDDIAEGYWRVQWDTFNSDTIQDGVYLIVNRNLQKAIKKANYCPYGDNSTVTGAFLEYAANWSDWEWSIEKVDDKYTISTGTDTPQYMKFNYNSYETTNSTVESGNAAVSLSDDLVKLTITTVTPAGEKSESYERNTVFIGDVDLDGWLNRRGDNYAGTWTGPDAGSCIRLYKKGYRVSAEVLTNTIDQVAGTELDYTASSWKAYEEALANVYSVCDNASEAFAEYEALIEAIYDLEVAKTKIVYKKLAQDSSVETGNYLIVTDRNVNGALANHRGAIGNQQFAVETLEFSNNETVNYIDSKYVWSITKKEDNSGYTIQDLEQKRYLKIESGNNQGGLGLVATPEAVMQIATPGDSGKLTIGNGSQYLHCYNHTDWGLGTYSNPNDAGSKLYLYKESVYVTDLAIADVTKNIVADSYTVESWEAYQTALDAAKVEFATKAEAEAALEELIEKKDGLKKSEVEKVYVKLTGTALPETGNYLITPDRTKSMGLYILGNEVITNTASNRVGNLKLSKIDNYVDETTVSVDSKYVWFLEKVEGGYYIKNVGNEKYLKIMDENSPSGLIFKSDAGEAAQVLTIASGNAYTTNTFSISGDGDGDGVIGYVNSYRQTESDDDVAGMGTYIYSYNNGSDLDGGNRLYLYQEKYRAKGSLVRAIEVSVGAAGSYTTDTWDTYQKALTEVKKGSVTIEEAEEALEILREAAIALKEVDYSVLKISFDRYPIDDSKTPLVEDGIYAIVGAHYDGRRYSQNKAVTNDGSFKDLDLGDGPDQAGAENIYSSIPEIKLSECAAFEWEFENTLETQNTYYVKSVQNGKYMQIGGSVTLQENPSEISIRRDDHPYSNAATYRNQGGVLLGSGNNVLNYDSVGGKAATWTYQTSANNNNNNQGSTYYLYKKQYRVDTDKFEAMVNSGAEYDATAKAAYEEALADAKALVGEASVVYDAHLALEEATKNLLESLLTEGMISAIDLNTAEEWSDDPNTDSKHATLSFANTEASLVKTETALTFDLLGASGFELLAACGRTTGMVMTVVKDANGNTLKAYLVDTYYDVDTPEFYVPIVRDMAIPAGAAVDVYGCLVKSVIEQRISASSTMSVRNRAIEVTTEDIVMAVLQELGLEDELDVADVAVSYMDEESILKGGTVSGLNTYAVSAVDETAIDTTAYSVNVHGCRIYRETQTVRYMALSELLANENTAFIRKNSEEFVLAEYQKTGPQNEVYLEPGESIVIGLASAPTVNYEIRVKDAEDKEVYKPLVFEKVQGTEQYQVTITNDGEDTIALGMIKMTSDSGVAPIEFIMTADLAEAVVAAMNAALNEVVNPFEDVTEDDFYFDAVLWALEEKITKGVSDISFAPGKECTRAEAVTFLWRAAGKPTATSVENTFTDVAAGSYYEEAVRWAVEEKITKGCSKEEFRPDDVCTRAQLVTFLWRAAGKPTAASIEDTFTDVVAGSYYEEAVQWALQSGITKGVDAEHFAPDNTCSRGETVTFLYRAMSE